MRKRLEKVFILIENVKVSTLGLQLHLGKTKQEKKNCRLVRKHRDGQDYSRELPGLRSQGKLKCAALLMREQLRKRMIYVRNISDIHVHKTGY